MSSTFVLDTTDVLPRPWGHSLCWSQHCLLASRSTHWDSISGLPQAMGWWKHLLKVKTVSNDFCVCAFNYVVLTCWWKLCLFYPFRSSNMILDLSRIEWVLFLGAWLCFSGVHTNFTLSSLTVLCFASIHSLPKVHLAHNDGLSCLNAGLYKGCHAVSQLVYTVHTMMVLLCWNSIFIVVQ